MTAVAVIRERGPGERRVAVVPDAVRRLHQLGLVVLVEPGAGAAAWFTDEDYRQAGAKVVPDPVRAGAGIVACVGPPETPLAPGQALVGLLNPLRRADLVRRWAAGGVTAISLDLLPRTLSRAQSMDALSSQATVAGYQAVLLAAGAYRRFFPMLTTAAGTSAPARVLVLGAGVAGLSAIATARRLGAVVIAFDVRPQAREEVRSLGARFLDLEGVGPAEGEGGYARALTEAEQRRLVAEIARHLAEFDVVITTAQVPGRRPPLLVSAEGLARMAPGSVVVDLAAGEAGGNVEGVAAGQRVTGRGVTVIGAGNAPAAMATGASEAYARNLSALLAHLVRDGELQIDLSDEIQAGVVVTHGGEVVHPAVTASLAAAVTEGAR